MVMNILVVEGNSEEILGRDRGHGLRAYGDLYKEALSNHAPEAVFHTLFPYAPARNSGLIDFSGYDGFVLTGSSLACGAETDEAKPYLRILEKILATGKPVLGSCWGMQTVCVLLGGMSGPNPRGSEIGVARNIRLTEPGQHHLLFQGMPHVFDSPAMHRDHVTRLPEGAELLASNDISEVQAIACQRNGVDYMGFQFHPEVPLDHFRQAEKMRQPLPGTVSEISHYPAEEPVEISDPAIRTRPLANWLRHVRESAARPSPAAA